MRFYLTISLALASLCCFAQPQIVFETIATGFSQPTDITGAGDGSERLFVTEKSGLIRIIDQTDYSVLSTPFLDLSDQILTNSERGVLGLAFHPDFENNGEFFVNYISDGTGSPSPGQTVVSRFTLSVPSSNVASIGTEDVLLTITQPFANHNAGDLAFGPDGYLYIPTGDGGSGGDPEDSGQDPQSLLGKMLRIDVDAAPAPGGPNYVVPGDNPFVGNNSVRDEIWALGLRNPWRISFDRVTGDLWIGDVGQNAREEVDFQPASSTGGENYGWDCREGFIAFSGNSSNLCGNGSTYTDPLFDYNETPPGGFYSQSLTGGFVYRGQRADDLVGWYLAADFSRDDLYLVPPGGSAMNVDKQPSGLNTITTFGEDDNGNLYAAGFGGNVAHVTTQRTLPAELTEWTAVSDEKQVLLRWATATEDNVSGFRLERSTDGTTFSSIAFTSAAGTSVLRQEYAHNDEEPPVGLLHYRLVRTDNDGAEEVYPVRRVYFSGSLNDGPLLSPNPVVRDLTVQIPELQQTGSVSVRIFAADGRLVHTRHASFNAGPQRLQLVLPELTPGIYRAVIGYDNRSFTRSLTVR